MREIAEARGTSRVDLIREINQTRSNANLSSAIRLFVLAYYHGWHSLRASCRRAKGQGKGGIVLRASYGDIGSLI
jgi:predicted DNA-binding ribbon-helix-helix protein